MHGVVNKKKKYKHDEMKKNIFIHEGQMIIGLPLTTRSKLPKNSTQKPANFAAAAAAAKKKKKNIPLIKNKTKNPPRKIKIKKFS